MARRNGPHPGFMAGLVAGALVLAAPTTVAAVTSRRRRPPQPKVVTYDWDRSWPAAPARD